MEVARFFYKLYSVDPGGDPIAFLGTCFPVGPNGSMLTCRHVVEIDVSSGARLAIFDNELGKFTVLPQEPIVSSVSQTDMAYLPNALNRLKGEFFPILTPPRLTVGEDVYSYGYFAIGGPSAKVESGYFAGKIVNFYQLGDDRKIMFTLPYAVIEGLSGSPVLTYHNGPKVVGVATGNRITRILAAETMEYKDDKVEFKESINRIVEFGTAMHCSAIAHFLASIAGSGAVVSDQNVQIPGLA